MKDLLGEMITHVLLDEKLQELFGVNGWKQLSDEIYKKALEKPTAYAVEEHLAYSFLCYKDDQTIANSN